VRVCLPCVRSGEALTADMLLQEMRLVDDHTLINEYFDAIERLVDLVMQGRGMQAQQEGLCTTLLHLQEVRRHVCGGHVQAVLVALVKRASTQASGRSAAVTAPPPPAPTVLILMCHAVRRPSRRTWALAR
jgi:hypothetical protein